ncbi:MAG TPA: oligoendopeptidase F [Vicinamibacterales bacterium]|nr:oligoendopeptidase F [Vicinamibacterales bacterium]
MSAFARPNSVELRRDLAEAAVGRAGGSSSAAPAPSTLVPAREAIDTKYTWDLTSIFSSWDAWEVAFQQLDQGIEAYKKYAGTLSQGAGQLLLALQDRDALGQLSYKVWYYPSLQYDEDQRNNTINARRQRVQLLIAKWQQATSWFNPELLTLRFDTVQQWLNASPELAVYRFAIEEVFRLQAHVLNEQGERLLSLSDRLGSVPRDSYAALSTADARFPTITLSTGESTQVSYGQYRKLLATCRSQTDRRLAYEALYDTYTASLNTYAAIYNGVMHGDWFEARARGYATTLDAALFGNAIPTSVVENLIRETKAGVAPFRRYHKLRKRVLGLGDYFVFDAFIPLVEYDVKYAYDDVLEWIVEAVAPLGPEYQARVRRAFSERWIDVYENQGKRSGAYSAPVYGGNPYMLMNYNDTLDAVFTLAHELGHSMHTMLSHETQPFVYAGYTIFVAEVPSTLNEALLLDYMLARAKSKEERIVLLQHAIDGIVGTFYNQVLFADFELEAHRLVERDQPITSEVLSGIYGKLLHEYWGDALSPDQRAQHTWARIPHFFQSPYYVYQYATCFASTAKLMEEIGGGDPATRKTAVTRYLDLLRSGGSDHPMALLKQAGVDLSHPEPVRAVSAQLDELVDKLERELS